jgi:hypothetical protein
MNTKLIKILLAGAVMAFGLSMRVAAGPVALLPDTTVSLVALLNSPPAAYVTLETDAFSSATVSGTVTAAVLKNDPNNPWASAGGLTFEYQIFNSPNSLDAITGIGIDGWVGYNTDVAYIAKGGGVIHPEFATRSLAADTVTFGWQNPEAGTGLVRIGITSDWVVIYSDATSWDYDTGGVRDGSGATMLIIGPATISGRVPDGGTTALLLGFGLLGMCWTVRRFKRS